MGDQAAKAGGVKVIERTHEAYATSRMQGYRAACHDCPWVGKLFSCGEKDAAREEATAHEAEMGIVYEVPEQVLTVDPRGVSGDERQPDAETNGLKRALYAIVEWGYGRDQNAVPITAPITQELRPGAWPGPEDVARFAEHALTQADPIRAGDERQPDALLYTEREVEAIIEAAHDHGVEAARDVEDGASTLDPPLTIEAATARAAELLGAAVPSVARAEGDSQSSARMHTGRSIAGDHGPVARAPETDVGDGDSVTDQFLVTITTAGDSPAITEGDLADVLGEVDQVPECGQWAFHVQRLPAEPAARASTPEDERPNRSTTERGFECFDSFKDEYGADLHVIESSAAVIEGEDRGPWVWIMVKGDSITDNDGAAHLDPVGARRVRDALDAWLGTLGVSTGTEDARERVARALYGEAMEGDEGAYQWEGGWPSTKERYRKMADTALAAARPEREAMVAALADLLCQEAYVRHGNSDSPCAGCRDDAARYVATVLAARPASEEDCNG